MEYTITGKSPAQLEEMLAQYKTLIAQRNDLATRLEKVEAEKGSVSPRIYEKVRTEYAGKLENLRKQLTPLEAELQEAEQECEAERSRLDEEIRVLEDELAEAEFRFRVGEFDQDKLSEIQQRLNPDLTEKSERRAEIAKQLESIGERSNGPTTREAASESRAGTGESDGDVPGAGESDHGDRADGGAGTPRATIEALDALTDDPPSSATEREPASGDGTGAPDAPTQAEDADPGDPSPAEERRETARGSTFENPQDWIDEFGENDQGGGNGRDAASARAGDGEAGSGADPDDDPLSALADPSGDKGAARSSQQTEESSGPVCTGFPNLVIVTGAGSGRKIPLLPMTMSVGREHDNNIELKDPDVGRYHARIMYESGKFVLEDLESSSGTWINGERITQATLKNGDRVKIGETEMVIDFD